MGQMPLRRVIHEQTGLAASSLRCGALAIRGGKCGQLDVIGMFRFVACLAGGENVIYSYQEFTLITGRIFFCFLGRHWLSS